MSINITGVVLIAISTLLMLVIPAYFLWQSTGDRPLRTFLQRACPKDWETFLVRNRKIRLIDAYYYPQENNGTCHHWRKVQAQHNTVWGLFEFVVENNPGQLTNITRHWLTNLNGWQISGENTVLRHGDNSVRLSKDPCKNYYSGDNGKEFVAECMRVVKHSDFAHWYATQVNEAFGWIDPAHLELSDQLVDITAKAARYLRDTRSLTNVRSFQDFSAREERGIAELLPSDEIQFN